TTIADLSKFVAALARHEGLSAGSYAEMLRPQLHIGTAHQFPNFAPELPVARQRKDLFAGLGLVVFEGPQGRGFFKGGHDEQTANMLVCLERTRDCVLIMSNDVRAEAGFAGLIKAILGDAGFPSDWEYGDRAGKS
ncbi:MAG TPA: serine hydrolase, partial [Phenylobacterium sp.]|nr:serine hydrolase [Phenylobacterium sp.]